MQSSVLSQGTWTKTSKSSLSRDLWKQLKNSSILCSRMHYFLCHLKPQHTSANWSFWTRGDTSFTHLVCWTLITCWQLPNDLLLASSFFSIFNFSGGVLTVLLKTSIFFWSLLLMRSWSCDDRSYLTHWFSWTWDAKIYINFQFTSTISSRYKLKTIPNKPMLASLAQIGSLRVDIIQL